MFYLMKKKNIRGEIRFLECKDASWRKPERNAEERKRKADGREGHFGRSWGRAC